MRWRPALSPLPWRATDDGAIDYRSSLPLEDACREASRHGFQGITAVPVDLIESQDFQHAVVSAGLAHAPGYLPVEVRDADQRAEAVDRAGRIARIFEGLGVSEMFVGASINPDEPRLATPAIGHGSDRRQLSDVALTLDLVGRETKRYGVTACLHPHVGSAVESEEEIEWLLQRLDPQFVALGPDTGHLAWAGVEIVDFARRHRDRIRAVHLKDVNLKVVDRTRGAGWHYRTVVLHGLWAEPGRGDLNLRSFLNALGETFAGWVIVEVDRPSRGTVAECVADCGEWVSAALA